MMRRETRRRRSRCQQALGERPGVVEPLRAALEARRGGHLADLFGVELVTGLRPDGLVLTQLALESGAANRDTLRLERPQMHFDPAVAAIPARFMREIPQR